jgi:hypothetical protein
MRLQSLSRHKGRFASSFKPKAAEEPAVDPVAYAWRRVNPRVPLPPPLRVDGGGSLGRGAP